MRLVKHLTILFCLKFNKSCFQKKDALLGFRHWLIILLVIGLTYGFIVFQDNRMPNVVEKENLEKFSEARARDFLTQVTRLGPRPSGSNACEVCVGLCFKMVFGLLEIRQLGTLFCANCCVLASTAVLKIKLVKRRTLRYD